ncbi:MBL fold metallo-hydrolase [Aquimarina sp. 2201CG5-10]|uniref:MBL fold metallo-hydrolase n=1 Tax=Aquimarina callyspongiae TaxID=3098150 RepID=UPI002AB32B7A|nr:MBL fold metallo-hydrolase [Aquimarina sp. 2201CG5-10]MDY8137339.1 MBL fold metallo-hydrolase [Aquimarina sp. 2201CG5-10]
MSKILFLFTTVLISTISLSQERISLVYTGNMGVYISDGQSSFLIDGLHTKYGDDYLFPSKELVKKIGSQLQPDAILFTHYHGDHFSAELSKEYLDHNQKSVLFGSSQIASNFRAYNKRIHTVTTSDYIKRTTNVGDLKITGFKINHAGKRHLAVENVGYIVDIKGKKILHVGDTNWLEEINLFDQLELIKEEIDIAILPYWMLLHEDATKLIKKHINPKQLVATHISPRIKKQELRELKKRYPKVYFLTKQEQQIQL